MRLDIGTLTAGASWLCAIHCTIIPALSVAAPFLAGAGAVLSPEVSASFSAFLPLLKLWFVFPLGVLWAALQLKAGGRAVGPALCSVAGLLALAASDGTLAAATHWVQQHLAAATGGELVTAAGTAGAAADTTTDNDAPSCGCSGSYSAEEAMGDAAAGVAWQKLVGPVLMLTAQWWRSTQTATAAACCSDAGDCCGPVAAADAGASKAADGAAAASCCGGSSDLGASAGRTAAAPHKPKAE